MEEMAYLHCSRWYSHDESDPGLNFKDISKTLGPYRVMLNEYFTLGDLIIILLKQHYYI